MSLRKQLVRNFDEAELSGIDRPPLYDGGLSGRVIGPGMPGVAARDLGCSVDVLPPGKVGAPYHAHYAQEEMFVILEGEGTLRVAGERIPVRAGDVIDIPPGPQYPHQLINTGTGPLKYLSISTQQRPEVCEYPDSGKYLLITGDASGLAGRSRMHRADSALDYFDGEP